MRIYKLQMEVCMKIIASIFTRHKTAKDGQVRSYTSKVSKVSRVSEVSKMSKQGEQQSLHAFSPCDSAEHKHTGGLFVREVGRIC